MEDRYDISVDIGDGKDWWYVHGLTTHEKVYELNRQMCDLGIPLRNPIEPISEETAQELIGKYEKIGKEWASKNKEIFESIFGNITNEKSNIMEKKTKKMTKAEAFEYFKGKKVYVNSHSAHIQATLFEAGYTWSSGSRNIDNEDMPFLLITNHGEFFTICNMREFAKVDYEEISVDDILSIEIVDGEDNIAEKNAFQQARDIMKWLREEQSPHTLMIIDGYHVELLDGVKAEVWKE